MFVFNNARCRLLPSTASRSGSGFDTPNKAFGNFKI
jgi:hypothetical protein